MEVDSICKLVFPDLLGLVFVFRERVERFLTRVLTHEESSAFAARALLLRYGSIEQAHSPVIGWRSR